MLAFLCIALYILKKKHTYVILDKRMYNGKPVHVFFEKN